MKIHPLVTVPIRYLRSSLYGVEIFDSHQPYSINNYFLFRVSWLWVGFGRHSRRRRGRIGTGRWLQSTIRFDHFENPTLWITEIDSGVFGLLLFHPDQFGDRSGSDSDYQKSFSWKIQTAAVRLERTLSWSWNVYNFRFLLIQGTIELPSIAWHISQPCAELCHVVSTSLWP